MMLKFTVFPHLKQKPEERANPYIENLILSLNNNQESTVINPPHKNPLFSILPIRRWGDVFIFNWPENIPDSKYGMLQSIVAIFYIYILKLARRKIIWVLHNKRPHANSHIRMKRFLTSIIVRQADIIYTHAKEGLDIIKAQYPFAIDRAHFIDHPTLNRLSMVPKDNGDIIYDLLIWGSISRYKGVLEFVSFLRKHPEVKLKVCIVGQCSSAPLFEELKEEAPSSVTIIPQGITFEQLGKYIACSHFVLAPYCPESVLSSAILMDSLSFGAKVIGPEVGSFKDYACEPRLKVYNFHKIEDIYSIVCNHREEKVSLSDYKEFLEENNWQNFTCKVIELVKEIM